MPQSRMGRLAVGGDVVSLVFLGVFIGLVEIKGTAESERPLTSYLAEVPCVFYRWDVQEKWSRTVTETYTDSDGKTRTRTRHESGWKTVAGGSDEQLFYARSRGFTRNEAVRMIVAGFFQRVFDRITIESVRVALAEAIGRRIRQYD